MKALIFAMTLAVASAAQGVQVGDRAVYALSYGATAPQEVLDVVKLTETVVAVDIAKKRYVVESVATSNAGFTVGTPSSRTVFLMTPHKSTVLVCIALEADIVQLATPAGEFRTCYLDNGQNKQWFITEFPETIKKVTTTEDLFGVAYEVTKELVEVEVASESVLPTP